MVKLHDLTKSDVCMQQVGDQEPRLHPVLFISGSKTAVIFLKAANYYLLICYDVCLSYEMSCHSIESYICDIYINTIICNQ